MDEVNLLDDGLVDVVLDSAASGLNTVEREGVSIIHPAKFIMLGSGNPMVCLTHFCISPVIAYILTVSLEFMLTPHMSLLSAETSCALQYNWDVATLAVADAVLLKKGCIVHSHSGTTGSCMHVPDIPGCVCVCA